MELSNIQHRMVELAEGGEAEQSKQDIISKISREIHRADMELNHVIVVLEHALELLDVDDVQEIYKTARKMIYGDEA